MANTKTILSEKERKARQVLYQQRYLAKKKREAACTRSIENEIPVNSTNPEPQPQTVSKIMFDNLQQSFVERSKQYEQLLNAYKGLSMKATTDGEAAKQFVRAAMIGLELLYPTQNKGGQN